MYRRLLWGLPLLGLLVLLAMATPADAAIGGPCTGQINGQDFGGKVVVPEEGKVSWQFTSTAGNITSWNLDLWFVKNWMAQPVASGVDEDPDQSTISGVADVRSYATYGAGVYELDGEVETEGGTCFGWVDIELGDFPLWTVAGGTATAVAVVGTGGAVAAGGAAAKGALAGLKP